jgi:hypothetical protein
VVIPIVVVAVLIILGILWWRKRKQNKAAEEARRKEVEDYGYNPNNDPTLPAIGAMGGESHEMSEDHNGGYRGWGAATTVAGAASSRKLSTTLSGGGHTQNQLSDAGSNMYGPAGSSPGYDAHSGDPLMARDPRRETMSSEEMGSMGMGSLGSGAALGGTAAAGGAAVAASHNNNGAGGIHRGPSNASSTYSGVAAGGGARSDISDDRPDMPIGHAYDYNSGNYGYTQHGPYGDGTYGGSAAPNGGDAGGMPVVRDVSARRNTRIQQPTVGQYPQGNAGISQNF